MKSATRSPIIIVVTLVLARMQSGMMEASATLRPSRPWTLPDWSTTAMGSEAGPILHVQDTWWPVLTCPQDVVVQGVVGLQLSVGGEDALAQQCAGGLVPG